MSSSSTASKAVLRLDASITIGDLDLAPIWCVDAHAPADTVGDAMAGFGFDVAGVDGPVPTRFVTRPCLGERDCVVGDAAEPIVLDGTVSVTDPTSRLSSVLAERAYVLVLGATGKVESIATRADLQRPSPRPRTNRTCRPTSLDAASRLASR